MRTLFVTSAAALSLLWALPTMAQDNFAIINTKVISNAPTGSGDNLTVLIQDGKIAAIGNTDTSANAPKPNGTTIIDGTGKWITPGLFAPFASIGLSEISLEADTNDISAADSLNSVSLRAIDSFNPRSATVSATLTEGITHAAIAGNAGSNIFGGTGAIVTTSGEFDSTLNAAAFVYTELGETGADVSGGSRAAAMAKLRGALSDAANYNRRFNGPEDGDALLRSDAAALVPALRGSIPLVIAADRASDLNSIIGLKVDYSTLDIIILGGAEAWMVAEALATANIAVLIDPTESLPSSFEQVGTREDNASRLKAANVTFAFTTRTSDWSHQVRLLPQHAGNAVANGLPWVDAFKAVTQTPAELFGQENLGILEIGQPANLVIWDGDPLEVMSAPERVLINGKTQNLSSRQTALADRYNPTNPENSLPYKYR